MSFHVGSREREFAMPGGVAHRGEVVRVGDTVRRPQNPGSRAIHALLQYLHDVGFDGAPRYLIIGGWVAQKWLVRGLSLGAVK